MTSKGWADTGRLPQGWYWTGYGYGQDRTLYSARPHRWACNVPDVVDTSRLAVQVYARECDKAEGRQS
jgi:hypothetical protein